MRVKRIAITALLVIIATIFWKILPPFLSDKIIGTVTIFSNERQCFNFHKDTLKDTYSAYLLSSHTITKKQASEYDPTAETRFGDYDALIVVRANAKNSFGAYGIVNFECPLIEGNFNETYALIHRLNQHINK